MEPLEAYSQPVGAVSAPSQTPAELRRIEALLDEHRAYRGACINLIASENITSPLVTRLQSNDLGHRYGDYRGVDPEARKYLGNRHITRLEACVTDLIKTLFDARCADLRPLSGHVAGEAVVLSLCQPGDTVLELDGIGGGHRLAEKLTAASLIRLTVRPLPFDAECFNLDVPRCREVIHALRPRLVILGSSNFLFPHPVSAIREIVDQVPGTTLLYDASHVLGLIAGCQFQKPLEEGAHIVSASTHKTFGGPQGGLILTNDMDLLRHVADAIYPALVTNHHLQRLPALGAACLEWRTFGQEHAAAIVENARFLAEALAARGLEVVGDGRSFTESHTVLLATRSRGRVADLARRLEQAGIIAGATVLPERYGRSGIRLGIQEMTRRGITPRDIRTLARWIDELLSGKRSPEECRPDVEAMALRLDQCLFSLE